MVTNLLKWVINPDLIKKTNGLKYKYLVALFTCSPKNPRIIDVSTNSDGETQYNCVTGKVTSVTGEHAEQQLLLNSLRRLTKATWGIL